MKKILNVKNEIKELKIKCKNTTNIEDLNAYESMIDMREKWLYRHDTIINKLKKIFL